VKKIFLIILMAALLVSCAPQAITPSVQQPQATLPRPVVTSMPVFNALWISPAVPDALRQVSQSWKIPAASSASTASLILDLQSPQSKTVTQQSLWIYALVAPFPTVTDGVTLDDLKSAWHGSSS